jgi:anti-sigma factor RsiW
MTGGEDQKLLLNAALDGELDAAGMLEIEAKLAADPALAREYRRLEALREATGRLNRPSAPDALRARVLAMTQRQTQTPQESSFRPSRPWRAYYGSLAASLMLGVLLGAGGYGLFAPPSSEDGADRAVVASYIRGRLSGAPVDIATSDRHTVKPWFAGKVAGATTVVDLKADGFPLVGGRVDVIGGRPAATLVYQRREHAIALTELPGGGEASGEPRREARDGYALLEWSDQTRRYVAISDLPPAELDTFAAAFRKAAAAEREEPAKP